MSGAARVFVTLDELALMLGLPAGHRLEAAEELPDGYRLGLALTIVSHAAPNLPISDATDAVIRMDMVTYRKWGAGNFSPEHRPIRTVLREVEESADLLRRDDHQHEQRLQNRANTAHYTPVKPPVDPTPVVAAAQGGDIQLVVPPPDDRVWPSFPGERLPYTGEDPGDEDIHVGGPR